MKNRRTHPSVRAALPAAAGLCIALVLFPACETALSPTYSVQLLSPEPGTTAGMSPTLTWRIENYTEGETYHVLIRTDVAENPLDQYYGHEFDTGWHSGQTQHATIALPHDRYRNAKVFWAVRVWDSHGTEYVCRDTTWWFWAIPKAGNGGGCTTCGI